MPGLKNIMALMGKPKSQETKDKIRKSCMGRIQSDESMRLASLTKTGRPLSESHINQIKKAKQDRSEEEIIVVNLKISESCKRAWVLRKLKSIK